VLAYSLLQVSEQIAVAPRLLLNMVAGVHHTIEVHHSSSGTLWLLPVNQHILLIFLLGCCSQHYQ
jgi:hypothetical protein